VTSGNPMSEPTLAGQSAGVWREIARFVPGCGSAQMVLGTGSGYCDFINNFPAPTRIAFD